MGTREGELLHRWIRSYISSFFSVSRAFTTQSEPESCEETELLTTCNSAPEWPTVALPVMDARAGQAVLAAMSLRDLTAVTLRTFSVLA